MPSILVIDDEPSLRHILRLVPEEAGHTVWEADYGIAGLVV